MCRKSVLEFVALLLSILENNLKKIFLIVYCAAFLRNKVYILIAIVVVTACSKANLEVS